MITALKCCFKDEISVKSANHRSKDSCLQLKLRKKQRWMNKIKCAKKGKFNKQN